MATTPVVLDVANMSQEDLVSAIVTLTAAIPIVDGRTKLLYKKNLKAAQEEMQNRGIRTAMARQQPPTTPTTPKAPARTAPKKAHHKPAHKTK
jgi:hypothetical protein